ncbi:MAG: SHD1 domain-containing protein [Planctomycetota bacterium]
MKTLSLLRKSLACLLSCLLVIDAATACRICSEQITSWSVCQAPSVSFVGDPCGAVSYACEAEPACGGCGAISACEPAAVEVSACDPPCGICSVCGDDAATGACDCGHVVHGDVFHYGETSGVIEHQHAAPTPAPRDIHDHAPIVAEPTPVVPEPFSEGGFSSAPLVDPPEAVAAEEEDIFEAGEPTDEAFAAEAPQPTPAVPADEELFAPDEDIAEDLTAPGPMDDGFVDEFEEPATDVESAFEDPAEAMADPADAEEDLFGFDDADPADAEEANALDDGFTDEPMEADEADLFDDGFDDNGFGEGDFDEGGFDSAEELPARDMDVADEPMGDVSAEDDLFGFDDEPAMEAEEPTDGFGDAFEQPAEDLAPPQDAVAPEEELFGFDDESQDATSLDEPAAPAEEFGDAFDDDGFDDEFGDEFGEPAGDLFDEGAEDFGEAAEEFGDGFDAPADNESPAEDAAEDDLFGDFGMILGEPGGYDSQRPRTWIDNSGRFSCQGRLVAVDGDTVRLAKSGGGVSRVPLARLSNADLEFVSRQVAARYDLNQLVGGSGVQTASR